MPRSPTLSRRNAFGMLRWCMPMDSSDYRHIFTMIRERTRRLNEQSEIRSETRRYLVEIRPWTCASMTIIESSKRVCNATAVYAKDSSDYRRILPRIRQQTRRLNEQSEIRSKCRRNTVEIQPRICASMTNIKSWKRVCNAMAVYTTGF